MENGMVYGFNETCKRIGLNTKFLSQSSGQNFYVQNFCSDFLNPEKMQLLKENTTDEYMIDKGYLNEMHVFYKTETFHEGEDDQKEFINVKPSSENQKIQVSLIEDRKLGPYKIRALKFETISEESSQSQEEKEVKKWKIFVFINPLGIESHA